MATRRKSPRELPAGPTESEEHAALQKILKLSAEYNDALYESLTQLSEIEAPAARPTALQNLTVQNQNMRREIDTMRASLQDKLGKQGKTFADVDGFTELLSEYRLITLRQQKRHMELFQRVRNMENVPDSPELHAYLKLGFKEDEQRQADTDMRLMEAADKQRELMLRAGRLLGSISTPESAATAAAELNELGRRYMEWTDIIRLYRDDDPRGAEHAVMELRNMYAGLLPTLKDQAQRLRESDFFAAPALRDVVERMLPRD